MKRPEYILFVCLVLICFTMTTCTIQQLIRKRYVPEPLTPQEIELRLLNLEELHTVTINNKVLTVEHVDIPTSSTVTYVKIPMNEWIKYEHLFGR